MSTNLPYRLGVNTLITNSEGLFLIVQLVGYKDNEWKFVGGGVDEDETLVDASYREIEEEVGISKDDLMLVGESTHVHSYDFPEDMDNPIKNKYQGQKKHQFVFKYIGEKNSLNIQEEEIKKYKWVSYKDLKSHLVFPNQFENAQKIIQEFKLDI